MALRKPIKKVQKSGTLGKGFLELGAFQIKSIGKAASEFDPNAIKISPKEPVPSEKRRLTFNDLNRVTRITSPILRNAVHTKQIYATRASLIQDLLNRGVIGPGNLGDFMHMSKSQFEKEVVELLCKL